MSAVCSEPYVLDVTRSTDKLGIWIPRSSTIGKVPRGVVHVTIRNQSGQASFMALAPSWTTIPSRIRQELGIEYGQTLSVLQVKRIEPHTRKPFDIKDGRVDMLSLIPDATSKGYLLYVDEYQTAGESWLSVWYYHPRGSGRQIELKRYVNAPTLGHLLGQLQAEGEKNGSRVAFKNASISEHADFVSALLQLGIPLHSIRGRCIFNPNKASLEMVDKYSESYGEITGIAISSSDKNAAMKGAIVAETFVRSTVLASVLISAMDEIRRQSVQDERVRQPFLAKLLSGDGSLDSRKTMKRLDVRVKIVDQNIEYLHDYAAILAKEGFRAKVRPEEFTVRAYCTWLNLVRLYEIEAFKGGKNWVKLLCSMKIAIKGRETRGYGRIRELSKLQAITSRDVCASYGIGRRASNLWLGTMQRLGLIQRLTNIQSDRYTRYGLTSSGKTTIGLIEGMEREYREMSNENGSISPERFLREIKTKGRASSGSPEQRT